MSFSNTHKHTVGRRSWGNLSGKPFTLCMRAQLLSRVWLFVTPLAVWGPLSMEVFRQEYWSRLPFTYSRGSSQPRDQTQMSCVSCTGRYILYHWATWNTLCIQGLKNMYSMVACHTGKSDMEVASQNISTQYWEWVPTLYFRRGLGSLVILSSKQQPPEFVSDAVKQSQTMVLTDKVLGVLGW